MQITKASGQVEKFNEEKLLNSLKGAGVEKEISKNALSLVKDNLSSDIDTKKIGDLVSLYLKQNSPPIHYVNYNLKKALFRLGPTGHPFEYLVARILKEFNYRTQVSVVLPGKCVSHEIDVVASKQDETFYIECKFHNRPGLKTDVQVALYTKARFDDIISNISTNRSKGGPQQKRHSWLITNTKATLDAIDYAHCQNIKITSWSYPADESLYKLITTSKLHPVTALTALSADQIKILLRQNIITLKDLLRSFKNKSTFDLFSQKAIRRIKEEIKAIYA